MNSKLYGVVNEKIIIIIKNIIEFQLITIQNENKKSSNCNRCSQPDLQLIALSVVTFNMQNQFKNLPLDV